jgi:hypothetical protein
MFEAPIEGIKVSQQAQEAPDRISMWSNPNSVAHWNRRLKAEGLETIKDRQTFLHQRFRPLTKKQRRRLRERQ